MSEPSPESPPEPAPPGSVTVDSSGILDRFLGHVHQWFSREVAPDLADLKADLARVKALAPELQVLANAVAALAKADPGIAPEVVADVERAVEVITEIAGELAATGM